MKAKHWVMDDNMAGFYRFHKNQRIKCVHPTAIHQAEITSDRFDNVWLSGLQYKSFCPEICKDKKNVITNTRIYSCILIRNDLDVELKTERWRGKYNEDTDLSLRVLKAGGANMLFLNFLCDKQTTKSCKGGNTDSIYKGDGIKMKLDSLIAQHPDVTKKSHKYQKEFHHQVDYSTWAKNPLYKDGRPVESGAQAPEDINEFGLKLIMLPTDKVAVVKKPKAKAIKFVSPAVVAMEEMVNSIIDELPIEEIEELITDKDAWEAGVAETDGNESDGSEGWEEDLELTFSWKKLCDGKDATILAQQQKIEMLEGLLKLYM